MFLQTLRNWTPRSRRQSRNNRPTAGSWKLLQLEDRVVPAGNGHIGYAIGSGPNNSPQVKVYDTAGVLIASFDAFPGFTGGVNVTIGVLRPGGGNTQPDIVVGAGEGAGPAVKVYDGAAIATGDQATIDTALSHPLRSFFAYGALFRGGSNVAIGNVNGAADPADPTGQTPEMDIITGAGPGGGPHVKVFDFNSGTLLYSYMAFDIDFEGGVSVGAGNVGGDNGNLPGPPLASDEIITGAGPGGGPQVKAWSVNRTDFDQPGRGQ